MQQSHFGAIPLQIGALAGRINDVDSHEAIPIALWSEVFGNVVRPYAEVLQQTELGGPPIRDEADINTRNVWHLKMENAPGAFDFDRRLEVLDFTGVHRQLVYPGALGLTSVAMFTSGDENMFKSLAVPDPR